MSENSDSTEKSKKSQGEKLVEDNTPSDVAFLYKSMSMLFWLLSRWFLILKFAEKPLIRT